MSCDNPDCRYLRRRLESSTRRHSVAMGFLRTVLETDPANLYELPNLAVEYLRVIAAMKLRSNGRRMGQPHRAARPAYRARKK